MYFKHIYEKGLAQSSYLLACQGTGEAIIIDPRRDIDVYLKIAEKEKFKIKYVAETHIHADFLSGSRELAAVTGAEMLLSDEGGPDWQYQFPHKGLRDGDKFKVGGLQFEVMHTPGHTPEHISFLLTDTAGADKPVMIFTGDFVFVGDVGRPDLLEKAAGIMGTKETGARQMFQSIKKFKALPDFVQVWPAHGSGSACGKAIGAVPSSTVGYEKLFNWALQINDEEKFVEALLEGQPEPPKYFAMMKKLNKTGPAVLGGIPHPARLTLSQFNEALDKNIRIIDARDKYSFAGGHIPGSVNIQGNSAFTIWAGWVLNYNEPFMLLASEDNMDELTRSLIRIGLDNIYGYIDTIDKWTSAGKELETLSQISVEELDKIMNDGSLQIIDVRGKTEYDKERIPDAANIPAGYILDRMNEIDKSKNIIVHCASGDRSSIALSLLQSAGIKNARNLTGGINAWKQSGKIIECGALTKEMA